MENLIGAGIGMLVLVGYFAVPALVATLAAVAVAHFEQSRDKAALRRRLSPRRIEPARMSGHPHPSV